MEEVERLALDVVVSTDESMFAEEDVALVVTPNDVEVFMTAKLLEVEVVVEALSAKTLAELVVPPFNTVTAELLAVASLVATADWALTEPYIDIRNNNDRCKALV